MISTPLRMENPVRRPIVPPIKPNWASSVTFKHCQRHNRPYGWVHITSSYTNLDQISNSENRFCINFIISTKHQYLNFNLKYWPNLASEYWPRINLVTSLNISSKILTKRQLQNLAWTWTSKSWPKCSKSEQKIKFMTKPQFPNLQQTVANTILITNTSYSNNLEFGVGIFTCQGHINQVY